MFPLDPILEYEAKALVLTLQKGSWVRVIKGRTVPKGTEGVVVWTGPGEYGPRIGLKDAQNTVHWTAESNCIVLVPGLQPGEDPEGGWACLQEKILENLRAWEAKLPQLGDRARLKTPPIAGTVGWAKGARLGLDVAGRDRIWVNSDEVLKILDDDTEEPYPTSPELVQAVPTRPAQTVPAATEIPPLTPKQTAVYQEVLDPLFRQPHPFKDYPFPLCNIRNIEQAPTGDWFAYDFLGAMVTKLPEAEALRLRDQILAWQKS